MVFEKYRIDTWSTTFEAKLIVILNSLGTKSKRLIDY